MIIQTKKKDFIWSFFSYFLKFGINIFIFPLVLNMLAPREYGLWVTFTSVGTIINLFDFGFSSTILRNLNYVWGGAKSLQKEGHNEEIQTNSERNDRLFTITFYTCKKIYSVIAIAALTASLTVGLVYISYITKDFFSGKYIIAWVIYSINISLNLYYAYSVVSLRAVGAIICSQKASILGYIVQIIISYTGMFAGGGIVALSLAGCICGFVTRFAAKFYINNYKGIGNILKDNKFYVTKNEIKKLFSILWYNAKKAGVSSVATVLMTQSTALISSAFLGVEITGEYGVCLQILNTLSGVSQIYYQTTIPQLANLRLHNENKKTYVIFGSGIVFSYVFFIVMSIIVGVFGHIILNIIRSQTTFNQIIFLIVFIKIFGEANYSMHASLISLDNELPFVRSVVFTTIILTICSFGICYFIRDIYVLLITQILIEQYIFWKWPLYAHKKLKITYLDLLKAGLSNWKNIFNIH